MREAIDAFNKFREGLLNSIYTGALARVESFDPAGKADITILPDGDLVQSVPVASIQGGGFFIRAPLSKGDLVAVLFSKNSIEGTMHGDADDDGSGDINDAIIVGGLNVFSDPLPAADAGSLVMGNVSGPGRITIAPDGLVTIIGKNKTDVW